MDIKLTEYVRATTLTLKVSDAPMTALPLIKDAFAKLATDLEEVMGPAPELPEMPFNVTWRKPVPTFEVGEKVHAAGLGAAVIKDVHLLAEEPPKRRGRPPKKQETKVETIDGFETGNTVAPNTPEPTPLEQAIAAAEDKKQPGESTPTASETESAEIKTETSTSTTPITDADLQKYCVKAAQHYGGPQKVYDLCKPFVEEDVVARPSNIKGDDKRWQFIRAVEADSGVKYHG